VFRYIYISEEYYGSKGVAIICVQHRDGKIGQASTGNAVSHNYLQNKLGAKILKHVATMHRYKVGLE
jgi:hypothetical protein